MRTLWAGTLPLMLVAGSLVAAPQIASPTQAAAAPVTTLSPSNPITMERFFYYSGVSTQFTRPVVLQKQVGSTWKTIFSGNTAASGRFRFTVHTGSVDTLRSYAAAVKHDGKTYPALATAPITVRPVNQSIGLTMSSASAATVTTNPGRSGRLVTLQRKSGSAWSHVSHARTDASGKYSFTFSASSGTYRAVAEGFNGAAAMTSASKSVSNLNYKWKYLSDMDTVTDDGWWSIDDAKMSGIYYHHSRGSYYDKLYGYYDLAGRRCTQFKAVIGPDDNSSGRKAAYDFVLDKDGTETKLGTVKIYNAKTVTQSISGVNRLGLVAYRVKGDPRSDYDGNGRWGDPQVYCAS